MSCRLARNASRRPSSVAVARAIGTRQWTGHTTKATTRRGHVGGSAIATAIGAAIDLVLESSGLRQHVLISEGFLACTVHDVCFGNVTRGWRRDGRGD